jgi:hypothetical protein
LEQAATRFINQLKGVDFNKNRLRLSSIYHWFSMDFGDSENELIQHLKQYAKPELKNQLSTFNGDIEYDYNWALNAPN